MKQDNGGPAFASGAVRKVRSRPGDTGSDWVTADIADSVHLGMSLRDYFIAHAPTEPQPWFTPVMPPCPMATLWVSEDGQRKYLDPYSAEKAEGDNFYLVNQEEINDWNHAFTKQYRVQWPAAWADEMIQQRSQP